MNENHLTIDKKYEIIKPLVHKIDSIFDNCSRDCHRKRFHKFKCSCIYYIKFTNIGKSEVFKSTVFDKNMGLYELNKN